MKPGGYLVVPAILFSLLVALALGQRAVERAAVAQDRGAPEAPRFAALEFDASGRYLRGWGGPADGYEWPAVAHGYGNRRIQVFTVDGTYRAQLFIDRGAESRRSASRVTESNPGSRVQKFVLRGVERL